MADPIEFTYCGRVLQVTVWDVGKGVTKDLRGLYDATEDHLAAAGFVRASRLAAAEAMVEDARNLARSVLENRMEWPEGVWHKWAKRILASRPSEQARHCPSCFALSQVFVLTADGERCPDPWHRPSEQASKEGSDDPTCVGSAGPDAPLSYEELTQQVEQLQRAARTGDIWKRKAQKLETQLAEAKASLVHQEKVSETYLMTIHSLGDERDDLRAKLEAAEAERAHLLGLDIGAIAGTWASRIAAIDRSSSNVADYLGRELAQLLRISPSSANNPAAAATEEPKRSELFKCLNFCGAIVPELMVCPACVEKANAVQPKPQGARLGGPADKLRADIVEAARAAGGMTESHWQAFAELLEQSR